MMLVQPWLLRSLHRINKCARDQCTNYLLEKWAEKEGSDPHEQFMTKVHDSWVLQLIWRTWGYKIPCIWSIQCWDWTYLSTATGWTRANTWGSRMVLKSGILSNRRDQMTRGCVVLQKQDSRGNAMGRILANYVLNLRLYHLEFSGVKVRELIANAMAESMYN